MPITAEQIRSLPDHPIRLVGRALDVPDRAGTRTKLPRISLRTAPHHASPNRCNIAATAVTPPVTNASRGCDRRSPAEVCTWSSVIVYHASWSATAWRPTTSGSNGRQAAGRARTSRQQRLAGAMATLAHLHFDQARRDASPLAQPARPGPPAKPMTRSHICTSVCHRKVAGPWHGREVGTHPAGARQDGRHGLPESLVAVGDD